MYKFIAVFVFVLGFSLFASPAKATFNVPAFHTEWQNKGSADYGTCQSEAVGLCGTYEGTQSVDQYQECKLVSGSGGFPCIAGAHRTVHSSQSCTIEKPACEEPTDYCSTLPGVQAEDEDCPSPEVPPVTVTKDSDDNDNSKCETPRDIRGFRFMFVPGGTRLRWTEQDHTNKVDIKVYGPDKSSFLYYVRTQDDGEYFFPNRVNWYRIRGVNHNCALGDWSKLVN